MPRPYCNIARVVRPHGSKGEVVVAALRGLPLCLQPGLQVALIPPALHRDRFCTVESVSSLDTAVRVRFSGITSLDDAQGISGCYVLARRSDIALSDLQAPIDELVGRCVIDTIRGEIGTISEVMLLPANDVWVVQGSRYGEVLIPVIPSVIPTLPSSGPIPVTLLDGLLQEKE